MNSNQRVSTQPIVALLRCAAPSQTAELDELFRRLDPAIELDRVNGRILFTASRDPHVITIGTECTRRLRVHAYVSAIMAIASAMASDAPERRRLYRIVDSLLNWAVSRDLQQWLLRMEGSERPLDDIIRGSGNELPESFLAQLNRDQRSFGEGLFRLASAFILLHELGHLALGHAACKGVNSILQEKAADEFAASWLLGDSSAKRPRRVNCLLGIATALLWLTIFNVYFGPDDECTHPNAYDRLFQVLDQAMIHETEDDVRFVWDFVAQILFVHMEHAGYQYDADRLQEHPRDEANYLIDLLSKGGPP